MRCATRSIPSCGIGNAGNKARTRWAPKGGDTTPIYDTNGQTDTRENKPPENMSYTLDWSHDVRFLGTEPYHSVTPLQPGPRNPWPWREAPEDLNEFLRRLAVQADS